MQLYRSWIDFTTDMRKKNLSAFSASIAFFFFLSVVPMLILTCTILPHTPLTENDLLEAVTEVVPGVAVPFLTNLIADIYGKSAGFMPIAVVAMLWSAAKGVMALMRGLNAVHGVEEKRNYFVIRMIATFYTFVMLVIEILSLFVNVFGNQLVDLILHQFPELHGLVSFLMNFRFIVVWIILTFFFAAIFTYVPDRKLSMKQQIPGAVFAAIGWSVYSWGFSIYLNYSDRYGIYGSLSIIIIVLLWMYFCMYIMLLGAYLNHYRNVKMIGKGSEAD